MTFSSVFSVAPFTFIKSSNSYINLFQMDTACLESSICNGVWHCFCTFLSTVYFSSKSFLHMPFTSSIRQVLQLVVKNCFSIISKYFATSK